MWLSSSICLFWLLPHFVNGKLSPIVFVPGAGGSRLYAKWDKPTTNSPFYCDRYEPKFRQLWPTVRVGLPIAVDCWIDNMRLVFNETTGETSNSPGVETKFPGFGVTKFTETLADFPITTRYLADFVEEMSKIGYQSGKNLHAAPYDFRKSPHEDEKYMDNLEALIEQTYAMNDNQPATLIGHSFGGLLVLYFLHRQDQVWKDKYIKSFVSVGTPFLGALSPVQAVISGYNLNVTFLPTLKLRKLQRSWPGTIALLPNENLWPNSDPIIITQKRNYTSRDYKDLFDDIGYPLGYKIYLEGRGRAKPEIPPNVKVFCMVATQLDTPQAYVYGAKNFPDVPPVKETLVDGDTTVPSYSANFCQKWSGRQNHSVAYQEFPKIVHVEFMSDPTAIAYMKSILMA